MVVKKQALRLLLLWPLLLLAACRTSTVPPQPEASTVTLSPVTFTTLPPSTATPTPARTPTTVPTSTPTTGPPPPVPTPIPPETDPIVEIPGSNYGLVELTPLDMPACCPTVAPDGERLAFATCRTMTQKVYVQNMDGSGLKEVSSLRIQHGDGPCPDPAWSPDGRQLAFVNYDDGLYLVDADGTNLTRLEPVGRDPTWAPDGQQIAFTAPHYDKGLAIAVMNRDGRDVRLLTDNEAHDQQPAWSPDGQQIAIASSPIPRASSSLDGIQTTSYLSARPTYQKTAVPPITTAAPPGTIII